MADAPSPAEAPIAAGTPVSLADGVTLHDTRYLAGGAPWRLVRLSSRAAQIAERWRDGGDVEAGTEVLARTLIDQGLLEPRFPLVDVVDDVDVVVVTHDEPRLAALLAHLHGLHVTVVDDASTDESAVATAVAAAEATLVRLAQNVGPAGARNRGLAATTRPLVWFLDADVDLDDSAGVLARLARHFGDSRVGAVAPRITGPAGSTWRQRFERAASPLDLGRHGGLVRPGAGVPYVPAASLLARRVALESGFDEEMRVGEDVDLVWRLDGAGWLVRYDARVSVTHHARDSWREWFAQRVTYGESAGPLATRHGARLAPLRADVAALTTWSLFFVGRPVAGLAAARRLREEITDRLDGESRVATSLTLRALTRGLGSSARAATRSYAPLLLVGVLRARTRRRVLALWVLGTLWRWRESRPRPSHVFLGALDDLAYNVGLWRGAWRERSLTALTPEIRGLDRVVTQRLGRP